MTDFEQALMNRDRISREEARRQKNEARAELWDIIEDGGSYSDVEDLLLDEYGLEMDYLLDLI